MSFDMQSFLVSCKGSLGLMDFMDVVPEPEALNVYKLAVALRPHQGLIAGMGKEAKAAMARAGSDPDFYWATWSDEQCMLQLNCAMAIDDLGPVNLGKALSMANALNGMTDRIYAIQVEQGERTIASARATILIPYTYLKGELEMEALRIIFRNTLTRFVVECQRNTVDMNMYLCDRPQANQ
jgi:hypothetical protein